MGHDTIGKVIFPMNAGFNESDITDNDTSYDYDNHTDQKAKAFMSVSVNPKFVQNNLLYENSIDADSTQAIQNSANFMEIRKTSHGTSISNEYTDKIGNRILPTTATLTDYGINRDETHSFKVKVYDSTINDTEINRKFVYSTTDYPASSEIGLDIENYDYFILLNPQLVEAGTDLVRPHLAKITRIVAFDEFGDGLEFSPSYTSAVAKDTKFEIFKGPIKTDTDVVAVSYGLRGDTSATTPKYDRVNICSLPTWYFYNDRLDEKNQLDYMTKYNATHLRWWAYSSTISITSATAHDQYNVGSTSKYFVLSEGDWDKLVEGQSVYDNSNNYIGNIASKYTDTTKRFFLDYARVEIDPAISSATDFKIGKTTQNVIFRTEGKFSNTIQNKGKERLDANLVDANYSADTNASTDFYKWTVALPKMHRHTANLLTSTVNTIDGNLTGSSKYLTFEKANFKNNKISLIQDAILNNPRNKMSQLASFTTLDNSGLQHLKVHEEDTLILQRNIHNDNFNMIAFEGIVSRHASETNKFVLSNIRKETDLRHMLSTNDIVELDGYYYVIDTISAQGTFTDATCDYNNDPTITMDSTSNLASGMSVSGTGIPADATIASITNSTTFELSASTTGGSVTNGTLTFTSDGTQSFIIKDKKLKAATVWTGSAVAENISQKTLYLTPYTGVINFTLEADTEVDYVSNRISIDGNTIDKDKTKLYNARLVSGLYNSHVNDIDYADRDNKFVKIQDSDRVFYQRSNESQDRFYYYIGGYSISDTVFTGIVEDISSSAEQGLTKFQITGRDDTSKLLSGSVTRNTVFMNDVIETSIPPLLDAAVAITGISSLSVSGTTITWAGTPSITPVRHGLILNQAGELIGEVKQYEENYSSTSDRITLYDSAYTTATSLKYYHPYSSTYVNYITGTKALSSNELHTTGMTGFTSISEKGLGFNDGLKIDGTFASNSATFTYSKLQGSSNTGNFLEDKTLGYDISSPKSISTEDSIFAFTVGNENGVTVTKNDIATLNKETLDVVQINEKDEGATILSVAPSFPMALGRLDSNTSDSRGNCNIYLINNNMNTGGFIHRLQNTFSGSGYYGPKETIRYWDLQKFAGGTITKTQTSIYNNGSKTQKIQGYCVGYGIKSDGTVETPTTTNDSEPLAGSNTIDGWDYIENFLGDQDDYPIIESYPGITNQGLTGYSGYKPGGWEQDIQYSTFKQIDPRAETYELLAVGDVFPFSKLRHNNIGYHTKNYDDFSVVLETDSSSTGSTSHQKYTGKTKQPLQTENMFEEASITSATQTTNQMRRFGVMKLVEATFDWHFNPVDYESLPTKAEDIPTVKTFDYVQADLPPVTETSSNGIAIDNDGVYVSDSVSQTVGDVFYQKVKIGQYPASAYNNNSSALGVNGFVGAYELANQTSNDWSINVLYDVLNPGGAEQEGLLRYEGGADYFGVQPFRIFGTTDFNIDNLNASDGSDELKADRNTLNNNIRFSHVWICSPAIDSTNFKWTKTLVDSSDATHTFQGHDIILPIISEEYKGTWSSNNFIREPDKKNRRLSAHHFFSTDHRHISRVVAGLYHKELSNSTTLTKNFRYSVGQTNANSGYLAHIYSGCIGIFRGFKQGADVHSENHGSSIIGNDNITLSTPLALSADSVYSDFVTSNTHDFEQTSRNVMVQEYAKTYSTVATAYTDGQTSLVLESTDLFGTTGNGWINGVAFSWTGNNTSTDTLTVPDLDADYAVGIVVEASRISLAMTGTKAQTSILSRNPYLLTYVSDQQKNRLPGYRFTSPKTTYENVTYTNNDKGGVFSAQMLIKPTFNITHGSNGVTVSTAQVTFALNSDTEHAWLSYLPDLTGYYLVSEKSGTNIPNSTTPATVRNTISNIQPKMIMKILSHTISTPPTASNTEGHTLTLDTTIDTSTNGTRYRLMRPSEVVFNEQENDVKFNRLLSDGRGRDWRTGGGRETDIPEYSESVYHMYLLLDIDNANSTIERRTGALSVAPFADLTSGDILDMHITDGQNSTRKKITVNTSGVLTLAFDGTLNGNGVVSFGEIFNMTIGRKPKLKNIKKCHVGTTYTIGSQLEREVENLVKEAGLEYNPSKSFSIPTGNLVNSNTSTTVVCSAAVENVAVGEVLYSYDGHLIGEVSIVSGSTITFTKKYYTPIQYDELIKINKRTFVTNLKFDDSNLYSAINSLVIKRGLDYTIKNGEFITRNIDDTSSLRKFALSYAESSRLVSVKSNKSMFDKANKVIVIGDKIKYELEKPTKKQTRVVKVIDPTIKTRTDAEVRAVEIMNLHSEDVRKIKIVLQKKGLELLEAGDILRLNFPNHNIPINDYIVFEIENVLAGALTLIVGTFDKTIAERLSEISLQQSDSNTTQFKRDAIEISAGKFLFDAITLKEISVAYAITGASNALSYNSNMGFDDIVGFTEEVGFEHSTVTKKSFDNEFYEQEDYT